MPIFRRRLRAAPAVTFVWAMHVETAPSHVAARFWFAAVFVGVIGYAASFLLYNYAIARVRAAPASIMRQSCWLAWPAASRRSGVLRDPRSTD
jgi:drug/metabolite transporter (DMT)-like permease